MKKIIVLLLSLSLFIPSINALELAGNAESVIVIEPITKKIVYERNSHERKNPASMTKIMTMLLVIEEIEKGNISWNDMVRVSSNASSMGGSQILLETNEEMSVEDLFKGLAVASGNDAAVALAEKVSGTVDEFVFKMNSRAKELGLEDTNFKNPHGLDDANHYSSAYDMALMAIELVKHPKVLEYTSIYEDYLRKGTDRAFWLVNTNKLVRFYKGVDGLKTGYTSAAGFCMTATANINDLRIITVVMGEPDSKTRNEEVSSILDYVYANYEIEKIIEKDIILKEVPVEKGKKTTVGIVASEDVVDFYKKSDGIKDLDYDIELTNIISPIKKGDIVGKLNLKENNEVIRTIDLTVSEDVPKANIIELYLRYLNKIIN